MGHSFKKMAVSGTSFNRRIGKEEVPFLPLLLSSSVLRRILTNLCRSIKNNQGNCEKA